MIGRQTLASPPRSGTLFALMSEAPRVLHERRGDTILVTLNAPERRNAIDQQMVDGLHALLDQYWHDESVAALVLTGAGDKAFAAGADIAQLRERTSRDALKAINSGIFARIEEFPAPVIAAIKGFALAAAANWRSPATCGSAANRRSSASPRSSSASSRPRAAPIACRG